MRTNADEKIDLAEESIKTATIALSDVVIEECYGADEYSTERMLVLTEALQELLLIKSRLRR